MLYKFICECGNSKDVNSSMKEIKTLEVTCNKCGKTMYQDWGSRVNFPDYMKADSDDDISWLDMNKRPSGKDKVYY